MRAAFLIGLFLGTILGVLLWPFLVYAKEPRFVEPYDSEPLGV